jgi:hypothetical protein
MVPIVNVMKYTRFIDPHRALISRSWMTPVACRRARQCKRRRDQHAMTTRVMGACRQVADVDVAEQSVRLERRVRLDAPDQLDDVFEDQEDRIRDEDQHDLVLAVHEAQQPALDVNFDDADQQGGSASSRLPPVGRR